ncbi:hypothetical protein DXG01_001048 [Tephrocybe rancida]|nr:hypothetical protein DXG01_001048 [Tephrocybe rancida]
MDISYSSVRSLPSLFYDLDGFSGSEGSTPTDSPIFYKRGESSRLSELRPVFHPPAIDFYKVWRDDGLYDEEIYSAPYQVQNQDIGVWEGVDEMDIDTMLYGSSSASHHDPSEDAGAQWPMWDPSVSCSIPVSAARSSLHCSSPSQSAFRVVWRESPVEDDLFGPASPLSSAASNDFGASHYSLAGPQPHNCHYDTIGSLYPYLPLASSHPSASAVSPIACSTSPASPLSSSTSSPESPSSPGFPPTPPTPVLLPELHQPRPGRPIPIIPLSELAAACQEFFVPLPTKTTDLPQPKRSRGEPQSSDQLSPLFPKSDPRFLSFSGEYALHDSPHFHSSGKVNVDERGSAIAYPYFNNGLDFDSYGVDFT